MIEIGGLQKVTLIDFPGRIATTLFLIGCNFRCPFCYSSELVLPDKIKLQPRISDKELFSFLKERQGLLEGVVICGGEPCINKDLPQFCKKIKKLGYLVKLDTNGSNPSMLKGLLRDKLIDYVAMDIKAPKEKYSLAAGVKVKVEDIEKSIALLKESGIDYEFRMTVVPTLHSEDDVIAAARWISPAKNFFLQNFRPEKTVDPKFEEIKPYPNDFLLGIQQKISPFFDSCRVRG